MRLREVVEILECEVLCGEESLDLPVRAGCGADLMSDVLASGDYGGILLTGLTNKQAVNTAIISDIVALVCVRGRRLQPEAVELARANGIVVLASRCSMFEACGKLYAAGLLSYRELQTAQRVSGVEA
jgi:predicted transcriptional regulator